MTEHECRKFNMVRITDINGQDIIRYLRLCDGMFFGGNTWSRTDGFAPGIHEMRQLGGMLDLIGKIANTPAPDLPQMSVYYLECEWTRVQISREMSVKDLAAIFGCDEQAIRDRFEPLVSITE